MSITSIRRDWGSGLSIVRIVSTDIESVVFAEGYLTAQENNIAAINGGAFSWSSTDYILVDYATGWSFATLSADQSTLNVATEPGEISGGGVTGQVSVFNGATSIGGSAALTFLAGVLAIIGSLTSSGNISVTTAGSGFRVKEGANAKQGVVTLVAGMGVVANTSVTVNSRILYNAQDSNTVGSLVISSRTAGTGFTITSTNDTDTGVVAYEIYEPA